MVAPRLAVGRSGVVTRAEELATHRWVRRHVTAALFGDAGPYHRPQGPGPGAGLVSGLVVALVVWAAPPVVEMVRGASVPAGSVPRTVEHPPDEEPANAGRRPE